MTFTIITCGYRKVVEFEWSVVAFAGFACFLNLNLEGNGSVAGFMQSWLALNFFKVAIKAH